MLAMVAQMEVKKSDTDDQLDRLLEQWANWMGESGNRLGLPKASAFARFAGSNMTMATATEYLESSVTPWEIQCVDSSIDDLMPEHRLILHVEWLGMHPAVIRYRRVPTTKDEYQARYADARAELTRRLKMKGCL